ncbi:sugar phosphate isomerase/epimerase family protein [Kineococcus rhizosphaerae]|uniref:Sugar phosphate isomerase/epimerase n=1 Tax=Kineococcus rhizosphaerae TaxID=559628 RepID=A0A2T0R1Y0_9ACTN|nr:sugar phosphate isomerase/epimerase family protein [Kineococcus rhizosphaerae]PRY13567.1 sugar phosphate isomerase/epimerase [Kineococcus rhizosphaerae]
MAVGVSTYAYQHRSAAQAVPLPGMLHEIADLGGQVFQICDHPDLETLTPPGAQELRAAADDRGLVLETGTRGTRPDHLRKHLALARSLGARTVRSMAYAVVDGVDDRPSHAEIVERLRLVVPEYAAAGVTLGLETYEQLTTTDLLAIVEAVDSPHLGIVLDPANCVANLEHPRDVVRRLAHRVVNVHVKDFVFTRREGWAGFTLASCPLGEGQLDYRDLLAVVQPDPERVHQVLEHWLVPQEDPASTCATEADWTERSLRTLIGYQ